MSIAQDDGSGADGACATIVTFDDSVAKSPAVLNGAKMSFKSQLPDT